MQRLELSRMADDLHFFFHSRGIYLNLLDPKFYRKFGIQVRGAIMPSMPDIFFQKLKTFLWTTQYCILSHTPNSNSNIHEYKNNKNVAKHLQENLECVSFHILVNLEKSTSTSNFQEQNLKRQYALKWSPEGQGLQAFLLLQEQFCYVFYYLMYGVGSNMKYCVCSP